MDIASDAAPPSEEPRPTLLIVDDEEGPRQSLRIVFKNEYNVLVASNAIDAMRIARETPIDVAVLDILMEGMSGVELLRELKEIDPAIEVVMLTAYETNETLRQALRLGASDYLNKPFDIPTMRKTVATAAQKRRTSKEFRLQNQLLQTLQHELLERREQEEMARTQGEIYASVLHDINSPLTVISGFVEMINGSVKNAARVEGEQLQSMKNDLSRLHGEISRCFEISRRYLSFLNTRPADKTYIGARQMLIDLKDLLIRHPSAEGNQLVIHDLDPDVTAEINGTDFLQILLNLTINALQASDMPHRVEVAARRLDHPLNLERMGDSPTERFINQTGFRNQAPLLSISVTDDGGGIAPAAMARLFSERFSTKPTGKGTGLGLSIVKRLIEEAQGAVHVRTEIGRGSTFTVFLQVHE